MNHLLVYPSEKLKKIETANSYTFPPVFIGLHDFVDHGDVFESFPLVLPNLVGIAAFLGAESVDVEHHFYCWVGYQSKVNLLSLPDHDLQNPLQGCVVTGLVMYRSTRYTFNLVRTASRLSGPRQVPTF